jgi:hypothetical protein
MPTVTSEPVLPALNYGEHMKMRRSFLSNAVELLQPLFLGKVESTFDDALAVYMLTAIAISEEETHSYLPQWLDFCKFLVKQMNLFIEPNRFDEESKEERRRCASSLIHLLENKLILCVRLWWATWIGDRHSALSFNLRTQLTELECQNLQRPYPDSIWELDSPLEPSLLDHKQARRIGVDTEIQDLDLFGIFIPLARYIYINTLLGCETSYWQRFADIQQYYRRHCRISFLATTQGIRFKRHSLRPESPNHRAKSRTVDTVSGSKNWIR